MSVYREGVELTGRLFENGKLTDEWITLTSEDFEGNYFIWEFSDKDYDTNVEVIRVDTEVEIVGIPKYAVVLNDGPTDNGFEYYYMNTLLDVNDFLRRIEPFIKLCERAKVFNDKMDNDLTTDSSNNKQVSREMNFDETIEHFEKLMAESESEKES